MDSQVVKLEMDPLAEASVECTEPGSPVGDPFRDHLITTAVKFLQNPRVRPTTLAQKKSFLKKKGLTDSEIEVACKNAGVYASDENNNSRSKMLVDPRVVLPTSRTSLLLKAMDVANMIALISIGSYSLYSLWKNYIAPRIFGTRSRLEQNYEKLLESMTKLNENVVELRELIREMQRQSAQSARSQSSFEIQEVKKEITAIKSLLLGQNQFPSPASTTGIPSWQMVEAASVEGDNSNENSDESSSRRRTKKDKSSRKQPDDTQSEKGDEEVPSGALMRKHPSLDSNSGFCSGSSCEVVFVGKNDSSDPDHSDE